MVFEERFSKLSEIWNTIGPFNMSLFGERLVLQKKIFLLKELGFDLGYSFSLYKRGPYCSELTADGYTLMAKEEIEKKNITNNAINTLLEISKGHESDIYWFELIATLVYLNRTSKINGKKLLREKLIEYKPYLNDESMFDEAFKILYEKRLIKS